MFQTWFLGYTDLDGLAEEKNKERQKSLKRWKKSRSMLYIRGFNVSEQEFTVNRETNNSFKSMFVEVSVFRFGYEGQSDTLV